MSDSMGSDAEPEDSVLESDAPDAFSVGNGLWNECALASQIVNGPVRVALLGGPGAPASLPDQWKPGFLRLVAWLYSLGQLQSPSDFQAIYTAARAFLEISVDPVLLRHQQDAAAQIADWEQSAKLKHAEGISRFYAGRQAPKEFREAIEFAQRERAAINDRRVARGWVRNNRPVHPDRWTTQHLGDDARAADGFEPDLGLSETYETQYRQICWYVHASGATGIRNVGRDIFPMVSGTGLRICSTLAVKYAKLMLRYANIWNTPFAGETWESIFERLRLTQVLTVHAAAFGPDVLERLVRDAKQSPEDGSQ